MALLLKVPSWSGGGPGMMRAASEGALMAEAEVALMAEAGTAVGVTVGAVRISREAGGPSAHTTERNEGGGEGGGGGGGPRLANYLPPGSSVLCKHMSTRKVSRRCTDSAGL